MCIQAPLRVNVLQCAAVCCSVLAIVPVLAGILESLGVKLEAIAVCCSVLQCVVCCSVLQCVAVCCLLVRC